MLNINPENILVSGPSITQREVNYAAEAAKTNWNHNANEYVNKFERCASEYFEGCRVMAVSSCTGALHVSLIAMGVGEGDEVIVPESTWIATAAVVKYVGATPVFCDVDRITWTIDTEKAEKLITAKTKAIIPVHLYGQPANMPEIMRIADKYGLYVLEDAAQNLGGTINGKKTGTWGHMAAFSFHGSKALVMGEGGMLVSRDKELFEKATFQISLGRHPDKMFYNLALGWKYKLSGVQAAIGLGQLERLDDIIAMKERVFRWYEKKLSHVPDIKLNAQIDGYKNTFWMDTIILGDSYKINQFELADKLKEKGVDTRPFFYPLSSLPALKKEIDNPVAYRLNGRGLNLPSGAERTEEEIEYICDSVSEILTGSGKAVKKGWLAFRDEAINKKDSVDFKDEKFIISNVDYANRLCAVEITGKCDGKYDGLSEVISGIFTSLGYRGVYICANESDKETVSALSAAGFCEIQRAPLMKTEKGFLDIIKEPFRKADDYRITFYKEA